MDKVFIIAEAGVNHNGSLELAKALVDKAVEARADAVKFQTFKTENIVCKNAEKAAYQKSTTDSDETQYSMLKRLELTSNMHEEIMHYCEEKGIVFLSTPFDLESIDYLNEIGISIMKIPSGEITNYPYLKKIGKTGKKVILSTGMSKMEEVRTAVNILRDNGSKDITVLHCNSDYPTPYLDVNLNAMITMKNELEIPVGYSDHTMGIEIPIAAVAMGARVIEKHFTLDRNMEGPDHKASLEPQELKKMVQAIRNVEAALGDGNKRPSKSEEKNISIVRKSIVAKRDIVKGELFSMDNMTTKRPGNGLSPMCWNEVVGKKAQKDFRRDEFIEI